jgi:hypothetical protein
VARFLSEQQGVAHNVGFGKTLPASSRPWKASGSGLPKADDCLLQRQLRRLVETIRRLYPGARILVTEDHHMQEKTGMRFCRG